MAEENDPPPLSDEYHKSRRNLTFASAILLSWEFIGIDLGKSAKLPALDIPLAIRNPGVVQIVLAALVVFFSIRLFIEWKQNAEARRIMLVSRADLAVSYILAATAISVYLFQKLSGIDIARILDENPEYLLLLMLALGLCGYLFLGPISIYKMYKKDSTLEQEKYLLARSAVSVIFAVLFIYPAYNKWLGTWGIVIVAAIYITSIYYLLWLDRKNSKKLTAP